MQIINKPIDEIEAYPNNPRRNDKAVDPVAKSIKEFGFKVPVLLDRNNVVIAGHTRLKAAEQLGMTEVPCIMCDDLTPDQVKAFRLADNKTAELADWDFEKLNIELGEIDLNMEDFGFSAEELAIFDDLESMDNIDDFFKDSAPKKHKESPLELTVFPADDEECEQLENYFKENGIQYLKN